MDFWITETKKSNFNLGLYSFKHKPMNPKTRDEKMSRYSNNRYNNEGSNISTFAQVTFGIIAASMILGTIAGIIMYMKEQAEIKKTQILATEMRKALALPKSQGQIVFEESQKAYQAAVRETADFKKVYQRPEKCNFMKDQKARVFCANHFMQARKEWEKYGKIDKYKE